MSVPAGIASVVACALPQLVDVASTASGRIERLLVRERDPLRRGQELLTLAEPGGDRRGIGRAARRHATDARRTSLTLRSSMEGVVVRRWVRPGDLVQHGERILSVARADPMHVLAVFQPGAAPDLPAGSTAVLRLRYPPGRELAARVLGPAWAPGLPGAPRSVPVGATRVLLQVDAFPPEALREERLARLEVVLPRFGREQLVGASLLATMLHPPVRACREPVP